MDAHTNEETGARSHGKGAGRRSDQAGYLFLPQLQLYSVSEEYIDGSLAISYKAKEDQATKTFYFSPRYRPSTRSDEAYRAGANPTVYKLYPIILRRDGTPWPEGNIWLFEHLEEKPLPLASSAASIADDLAAFRRFIDDQKEGFSWLQFPSHKLWRPTYRFRANLISVVGAGGSDIVANRRISTMTRLYRWLKEAGFDFSNPPWKEKKKSVAVSNSYGGTLLKEISTTDLAIPISLKDDPWDGCISDEGKLRPLPKEEQVALVESLLAIGNTEMTLLHLFMLFTGTRVQTAATLRRHHFEANPENIHGPDVRIKAGPSTDIDTKNGRKGVIHIPIWLYKMIHVYVVSERAIARRRKGLGGDTSQQFVFLSRCGNPLYDPRPNLHEARLQDRQRRYINNGQAIRQFKRERLLPEMRRRLNNENYYFREHDLRATFGLNVVDSFEPLIAAKTMTYIKAMNTLRALMWHADIDTTEGYFTFRTREKSMHLANEGWHMNLAKLVAQRLVNISSDK